MFFFRLVLHYFLVFGKISRQSISLHIPNFLRVYECLIRLKFAVRAERILSRGVTNFFLEILGE